MSRKRDKADDVRDIFAGKEKKKHAILGLEDFPNRLWILQTKTEEHLTMSLESDLKTLGLVCFSSNRLATIFAHVVFDEKDIEAVPVSCTFDLARELAQSMPNCPALQLLDDPDNRVIHWVK